MDIGVTTLLVALMFVTVLSMGIGSTLSSLATVVAGEAPSEHGVPSTSWRALLLLAHLVLFWSTSDLLLVEGWGFGGFLVVIAGPILMLFSTGVLVAAAGQDERTEAVARFQRFLLLFAGVQAWILLADWLIDFRLDPVAAINAVTLVVLVLAGRSVDPRRWRLAGGTTWLLYLLTAALRIAEAGSA